MRIGKKKVAVILATSALALASTSVSSPAQAIGAPYWCSTSNSLPYQVYNPGTGFVENREGGFCSWVKGQSVRANVGGGAHYIIRVGASLKHYPPAWYKVPV